jgi:DNA-binding SARP family transcriptional activator/tetratricopeptide (TPR) repeat protein
VSRNALGIPLERRTGTSDLEIRILGPLEVVTGGGQPHLGGSKQRTVLGLLALHVGDGISRDWLVEALWPAGPPRHPLASLHAYVSNVRRLLAPSADAGEVIIRDGNRYCLAVAPETVDLVRFEALVRRADELAARRYTSGVASAYQAALSLARGPLLDGLDAPGLEVSRMRVNELQWRAVEGLREAQLDAGLHATLVPLLAVDVEEFPFRERLWCQFAVALYRSGRQADALDAIARLRRLLAEELGIDLSAEVRELEVAILRHDPDLIGPRPGGRESGVRQMGFLLPAVLDRACRRPVVGRSDVVETIRRAALPTSAGLAKGLALVGEAGSGKTTAVAKAMQTLSDTFLVLYGRGDDLPSTSFQPFAEAFGSATGHLAGPAGSLLTPRLKELLDHPPALDVRASADDNEPVLEARPPHREEVFDSVLRWFRLVSSEIPVALVLDDLHWASTDTLHLLRYLLAADSVRLFVLCTWRDPTSDDLADLSVDLAKSGGGTVSLTPLSPEDLEELAVRLVRSSSLEEPAALGRKIHRLTGGNAFFATEVLRMIDEGGAADVTATLTAVPPTVAGMVRQRVETLPAEAQELLRAAAAWGFEFDLDVIATASGLQLDEAHRAAIAAEHVRLLERQSGGGIRFRFVHMLTRAALYADVGGDAPKWHRRLAEALAAHRPRSGPVLRQLADHYAMAASIGCVDEALLANTAAGEDARTRGAYHEAIGYLRRAIDFLDQLPDRGDTNRARLLLTLGRCQRDSGGEDFRGTLLEAASFAEAEGDQETLIEAVLANNRGMFSIGGSADQQRLDMIDRALAGCRGDELQARLLALKALELVYGADLPTRRAVADAALEHARRAGDELTLVTVLTHRLIALPEPSAHAERLRDTNELAGLAEGSRDQGLRFWAAQRRFITALQQGDGPAADWALWTMQEMCDDLDRPTLRWVLQTHRSLRARISGQLDASEALARDALREARATAQPEAGAYYGTLMLYLRLDRGWLDGLPEAIDRSILAYPQYPIVRVQGALVRAAHGQVQEARRLVEPLLVGGLATLARGPNEFLEALVLLAHVAADHLPEFAPDLVDYLAPYSDQVAANGLTCVGSVAHALGILELRLGEFDSAADHLAAALDAHRRLDAPGLEAATLVAKARLTRAQGRNRRSADLLLKEASSRIDGLGYGALENQIQSLRF